MNRDIVDRAIVFATEKHAGAFRKGTKIPYILHPLEAAAIVAGITEDKEVIAAAVLHDVVEDAGVTADELMEQFGERVAYLVAHESENKRTGQDRALTWRVRKQETVDALRSTEDIGIMAIALGDKLSNIRSIARDYHQVGERVWDRFNIKDKAQHGWYYSSIADALSALSGTDAWKEYRALVDEVFGT